MKMSTWAHLCLKLSLQGSDEEEVNMQDSLLKRVTCLHMPSKALKSSTGENWEEDTPW